MSERRKPHNGRDTDGRFRVRQADVEDLLEDPQGVDHVRDDVRLGGAVADIGPHAADPARHISELIEDNQYEVGRGRQQRPARKRRR